MLSLETTQDFPAPADRPLQLRRAILSPFEGDGIHTRMTSQFTSFAAQSAVVDASVIIDAHDLSVIRDAKDVYHGSLRIVADARSGQGQATTPIERSYDITMPAAEYERALRDGLLFTVSLRLPATGVWCIRTLVADGVSDRLGSSSQSLWIPARGEFAISSLSLDGARIYKPGQTVQFAYNVFQPMLDENKQAHLEVRNRLLSQGHAIFVGTPIRLTYPTTAASTFRQVSGRLSLDPDISPGDYILEVTVIDKLAPPEAPRKATRLIDFQLRN